MSRAAFDLASRIALKLNRNGVIEEPAYWDPNGGFWCRVWWEHWYADEDSEDSVCVIGWWEAEFWVDLSSELGLS